MEISEVNKKVLLKVLLLRAENYRKLTPEEKKVESQLKGVSISNIAEIEEVLIKDSLIKTHIVDINPPDSSGIVKVFPYLSPEGEGLTQKGEEVLKAALGNFNKEKKIKNKDKVSRFLKPVIKWILGIVAAVLAAFIIKKLGWQ